MDRNTIKILDIAIDNVTNKEATLKLASLFERNDHSIITTPNPEFIMRAQKDDEFKDILNKKSELNLPDGVGLLWAAKFETFWAPENLFLRSIYLFFIWIFTIILLPVCPKSFRYPIRERVSGTDFLWEIARFAAENKYRLFLLGGEPTVAERTALKLQTDVLNLRVAGVHSGSPAQTKEIIEAINRSKAEILIVCYGAPKQEKWLAQNLSKTSCKIGIGLGGAFDFVAGARVRAPKWMQKTGLEWLYRLMIEPNRIGRQLSIPKFMWKVLVEKIKQTSI